MSAEIDTSKPQSWVVVTQVKSHRIVYFTDDGDYQPPMHGDWYYVSPYRGALPKGMTLRNCWRWRFNGMEFVDAGKTKPADPEASLLLNNKQALLDILAQRIDAIRRPHEPSSVGGAELRELKLAEARQVLDGLEADTPLLREAAAAYGCTVTEMARRIVERHAQRREVLLATEREREAITAAVRCATSQKELIALRQRIVDEVCSGQVGLPAVSPEHTTPSKMDRAITTQELESERLRLRVQLRNRINHLRRPFVSQYLLDDQVVARKVEIAHAVQRVGGALPPGLDGASLLSHAATRGQGLAEAARDVLAESHEITAALLLTEQMKDAMLSRIADAKELSHIRDIGQAIERLALEPKAAA